MHVVIEYPDGLFCWIDLATSDIAGAKVFYSGLFGWESVDVPIPGGGSYTNFTINGNRVAGGSQLDPAMQPDSSTVWTSYVKHSSVDDVAAKVTAAGGSVMWPAMDVMEEGRMGMYQDPTGAFFGVWEPKNHIGAQHVNAPNTLVWNELMTTDQDQAAEFYGKVFDWKKSDDGSGYGMFAVGERIQAGMMTIDPATMGEMPPHWGMYIMVEDIDASAAKVVELGGTLLRPVFAAGEMGRMAVVQDPQGAVFNIMQFNGPVDPPPSA